MSDSDQSCEEKKGSKEEEGVVSVGWLQKALLMGDILQSPEG